MNGMQRILTTDDLRETKQHGQPDFPIQYYLDDTRDFYNSQVDWHWHNEFEIVAVSEGVVDCHVGQESFRLKAGEAVFINSRVLHQFTAKDYCIMPNIVFSPEFIAPEQTVIYDKFIAPIEKSTMEYLVFKNTCEWHNRVLELLSTLFCEISVDGFNELKVRNILSEAWVIILEQVRHTLRENNCVNDANSSGNSVKLMIQYIGAHYMEEISLNDIAASVNISKNTAMRYFAANIGVSPVDYLIKYRIGISCKMLRETSDKISHIAGCVGYENTSYFCRLFRKYVGVSPKKYREQSGY